jgi:hypothetical protein
MTTPKAPNGRLADDLLWGAKAIAIEIFGSDYAKSVRRIFYLLETKLISAEKVGDQWVSSRQGLRRRFERIING